MKNISFGLYRFLPGCQKSDIKETKNGIYFCTGESNVEVMLGGITFSYYFLRKQLFRNVASLLCIPPFFWCHWGRALWFHLTASWHPSQAPGQGEGARDARLALGSDKAFHPLKVTLTLGAGPIGCQLLWTCHGLLSTLMMTTARSRPAQHCMWTLSLSFFFSLSLQHYVKNALCINLVFFYFDWSGG